MVDEGNAIALVAVLADLVRAGEADLSDAEPADARVVAALSAAFLAC